MINNFTRKSSSINLTLIIGLKMFVGTLTQLKQMHTVVATAARLCLNNWTKFSSNYEQDPIRLASFYKGFGQY